MAMGFSKASKLWALYQGTSTVQAYLKEAKTKFPDDDGVVLRAMWYAFDASKAQEKPAAAKPRARERLSEPIRKTATRGRK